MGDLGLLFILIESIVHIYLVFVLLTLYSFSLYNFFPSVSLELGLRTKLSNGSLRSLPHTRSPPLKGRHKGFQYGYPKKDHIP